MSEMVMSACKTCNGDGVVRFSRSYLDPQFNVAGLVLVGDVWTGTCRSCKGQGIFEYTRGVSLTPIVRAALTDGGE